MNWIWLGVGFLFSLVNTFALWRKNRKLEGVAKPATMLFLIVGLISSGIQISDFPNHLIYFIIGATFCLIGDVFLYLPPEKYFQLGLVAFLLGHIGYIFGFGWIADTQNQLFPIFIFLTVLIVVSSQITLKIIRSLRNSGRNRLVIPIILYSMTISTMVFLAGIRFFDFQWSIVDAYLVAFGALSFFISDVLNAWERFVRGFSHSRIIIMVLYHLGQYGIGIGVILHFAS